MKKIDGKQLAATIKDEIAAEVVKIKAANEKIPHLAAVLLIQKDASTTEEELLAIVEELNRDADIDGFIVQLPLPKHINEESVTLAVAPEKDVDGFHPINFGRMAQGLPCYLPATPFGIMQMLERYDIETSGKRCVILGRSNIVGTPMSILLSRKAKVGNCTVTLTHSRTKNIAEETKQADILIAAIGIPNYVTADMVKEGVVVIDVGINRVEDASRKRGYRLVGDVDYDAVAPKCSYITPVPGGVGPMTITSLLMINFNFKLKFKPRCYQTFV